MGASDSSLFHLGRRVALRRLTAADLADFQAYRLDEIVGLYQGWQPLSDRAAMVFLTEMAVAVPFEPGVWFQMGIADAGSNALIGDIGICLSANGDEAEIGFTLSSPFQGMGLAGEAVLAAIRLVFDRSKAERVIAITDARNTSAIALLNRVGMTLQATAPALFRGEPCIEHHYALNRP